jgi:hypothetical protein
MQDRGGSSNAIQSPNAAGVAGSLRRLKASNGPEALVVVALPGVSMNGTVSAARRVQPGQDRAQLPRGPLPFWRCRLLSSQSSVNPIAE